MRRFIKQVALFSIPFWFIGAFIAVFYCCGFKVGELRDFDDMMINQRRNDGLLVGLAYNEQTPYYKLENSNYFKADCLALGTSRVMQFKSFCFMSSFYNAGGAVSNNFDEYLTFLENLDYNPQILILGLDIWVFNDNWNRKCPSFDEYMSINLIERNKSIILKTFISDWIDRKWNFKDISNFPGNYGMNGVVKQEGYMADGSYYYGDAYRNPEDQIDYKFKDTINRIQRGKDRFEYGDEIDQDTVEKLDRLLNYCHINNIYCIGVITPLAPSVYNIMEESGNYRYLESIQPVCKNIFNKYEFEIFDYLDAEELGMEDDYFIDGFHGSEVAYTMILKNMADCGSMIKSCIDREKICNLLKDRYNNIVFRKPDKGVSGRNHEDWSCTDEYCLGK